jgi:hypothetical protein
MQDVGSLLLEALFAAMGSGGWRSVEVLTTVRWQDEVGERGLVHWMDWGYNLQGGIGIARRANPVRREKTTALVSMTLFVQNLMTLTVLSLIWSVEVVGFEPRTTVSFSRLSVASS